MPFAIRRVRDGAWLKRTTSNKTFIDDPMKASTWARSNDAMATLRHMNISLQQEAPEVEIVEIEWRVVRITHRLQMHVDPDRSWKSGYIKVDMRTPTFRQADE